MITVRLQLLTRRGVPTGLLSIVLLSKLDFATFLLTVLKHSHFRNRWLNSAKSENSFTIADLTSCQPAKKALLPRTIASTHQTKSLRISVRCDNFRLEWIMLSPQPMGGLV